MYDEPVFALPFGDLDHLLNALDQELGTINHLNGQTLSDEVADPDFADLFTEIRPSSNMPPATVANRDPVTYLGEIVVTGQRQQLTGFVSPSWGSYSPYPEGSSEPYVWNPDYTCSDPPDGAYPDDLTLERIRRIVDEVADRLSAADIDQSVEWGAIIYMTQDGRMYHTDPVSQSDPGSIGFSYGPSYIPDGVTIVGWYHTHPFVPGTGDQAGLSSVDFGAYTTMLIESMNQGNRFTVSDRLLTYVKDNLTGATYEFDLTDGVGTQGVRVNRC